jgi:hypothetical protein
MIRCIYSALYHTLATTTDGIEVIARHVGKWHILAHELRNYTAQIVDVVCPVVV